MIESSCPKTAPNYFQTVLLYWYLEIEPSFHYALPKYQIVFGYCLQISVGFRNPDVEGPGTLNTDFEIWKYHKRKGDSSTWSYGWW